MNKSFSPSVRTKKVAMVALVTLATVILVACVYGCAPKGATESQAATGNESSTTMQGDFAFSSDADCGICHETESESMADTACTASLHVSQTCADCHSDTSGLTSAHDGVQYGDKVAKRLKTTEVDEATCLTAACHGSYAALAEKTAANTVLTDTNGTVVNPHAMPENEDHTTVTCGSCHDMHSSDAISDTAQKACQSCHHTGVYECNTCHE